MFGFTHSDIVRATRQKRSWPFHIVCNIASQRINSISCNTAHQRMVYTAHNGSVVVRTSVSRLREPGLESSCCCFEAWAISFTPHCLSSLSCRSKYLAIDSGEYMLTNSLLAVIATWVNASQRRQVGVRMNGSARG